MRALISATGQIWLETEWDEYTRANLTWAHTEAPEGAGWALCEDYEAGYGWIITVRDGMLYATRGAPLASGAGTESPGTEEASASESATIAAQTISAGTVTATASATVPTVDKSDSSTSAASTAFVVAMTSDTGGTVNNLLHTNGDEESSGEKRGTWVWHIVKTPPIAVSDATHWVRYVSYPSALISRRIRVRGYGSANMSCYYEAVLPSTLRGISIVRAPGFASPDIVSLVNSETGNNEIWLRLRTSGTSSRSTNRLQVSWEYETTVNVINEEAETLPDYTNLFIIGGSVE